jgi:diguanylate cyclase (GGDEF)-like protein
MSEGQIEHDRIRLKKRNGEYSWYRSQYKAIYGPDGRVEQVIGTLTDISAQIVREIELRKQAQLDPLTGLYNRAGVKLINARLEQISRGVLFMMDLDDFKSVNDNYGHAAGDQLLTAIAGILMETFRADDIVARVGGDEFVAFLSGSDSRRLSEQKGQELLERVRGLRLEGMDIRASVSIGAAGAPSYGSTYEELSAVADEALYEVKNRGKGGFCLK